jgi:hypothetical protein
MLDIVGLSKEWWGEAILTTFHVLNRVPMKNKEITPFEEWEKKKVNTFLLTYLGLFGKGQCAITKKHKLRPKPVDCVFLGYAIHNMGYRFLVVKSGVPDMMLVQLLTQRCYIL